MYESNSPHFPQSDIGVLALDTNSIRQHVDLTQRHCNLAPAVIAKKMFVPAFH
jgi:hypothetical protein